MSIDETLAASYPWCGEWKVELKRLFASYVAAKQRDNVLDYDDLLRVTGTSLASFRRF